MDEVVVNPKPDANAAFWEREDVKGAQRLLDLWASQRAHIEHGGQGVIKASAVFEVPAREIEIIRNGMKWIEPEVRKSWQELPCRVTDLAPAMQACMFVNAVLVQLDLAPARSRGIVSLVEGLLIHLYPRTGPYQAKGDHRSFRLLGELSGMYLTRATERWLRQVERDFLAQLIEAGRSPSRFFGGEVVKDLGARALEPLVYRAPYTVPTAEEIDAGRKEAI